MKTQKTQHSRLPLLLILTLAGPALALEETLPMQAVNEALQTRIEQQVGSSLEREFYNRSASRQASPRDAATATNHRSDQPAAVDCSSPPMAPVTQQYLSAR
jgi:hypothetical protein